MEFIYGIKILTESTPELESLGQNQLGVRENKLSELFSPNSLRRIIMSRVTKILLFLIMQ